MAATAGTSGPVDGVEVKAQAAWGNTYTVTGFWVAKWQQITSSGWRFVLEPFGLNLPAIGRMTCVLFPAFIWLGTRTRTRSRFLVAVGVFLAAQRLRAVHFFTWGRIM